MEKTALIDRDRLSWLEGDMPFSERFGDSFYAKQDGRAETDHVFIGQNDLLSRWADGDNFVIGELGFGTGLNLFETWRQWKTARTQGQHLTFVTFEAFPMEREAMQKAIGRWPDLVPLLEAFLPLWDHLSTLHSVFELDEQTRFEIHIGPALDKLPYWYGKANAWYLDGFAPAKNPQMWSAELMQAVFDRTVAGGTFSSYTSAGWVRRHLAAAGFTVQKVKGHGTKRDMVRGYRPH